MEYDLNEYDPFEPLYMWDDGDGFWLDSEPMEDYNWLEWLEADDYD